MAVRFDSLSDDFAKTSSLPASILNHTLSFWFMLHTAPSSGQTRYLCTHSGGGHFFDVFMQNDAVLEYYTNGNFVTGSTILTGIWYHFARTIASGSNACKVYLNGIQDIQGTDVSLATGAPSTVSIGYSPSSESADMTVAAIKWHTAVLTPEEILNEMMQYLPLRTINLYSWSPSLSITDDGIDYSGNGNSWTVNGNPINIDGPPIPWKLGKRKSLYIPDTTPISTSSSGIVRRGDLTLLGCGV